TNMENPPPYPGNVPPPNPAYPNYPAGPMGPGGPYPGPGQPPYNGYPGQPQFGWQGVYVVEDRRRDDTADTCLTACWTALCCCCLWDMLT
uniref:Cysteine-rich and transmembrane domain-containing protein 1 n=1 Tax=Amphilophus citrinellus TaxID=61819 RepID=A0A3Q0SC78_AMPCI